MLKLEISGATAHELVVNAMQTLALLVKGAQGITGAARAEPLPTASEAIAAQEAARQVAEPLENPKVDVQPAKPKRQTKAEKAAAQIDLEAAIDATPKKPEVANDPLPADMQPKAEAPKYMIEDCRNAVRQVYENFEKRARAAGATDETKIMADKIAYTKPLVYGFDIQKVVDLKPDQFASFIAKAKGYIDGTVPAPEVA